MDEDLVKKAKLGKALKILKKHQEEQNAFIKSLEGQKFINEWIRSLMKDSPWDKQNGK